MFYPKYVKKNLSSFSKSGGKNRGPTPLSIFFQATPEQFCETRENICDVLSKFYCGSVFMRIGYVLRSTFGAV
jgi:hypothetical protein